MKTIPLITPTLFYLYAIFAQLAYASDITAMTFNLRIPVDPPPYDWQTRLPRIIAVIKHQQPDILGVQEVTPAMRQDLQAALEGYAFVGRGRELGGEGEGTYIVFSKARWELDADDQGTRQLSSTPDLVGSNDWGMKWPRIFTWAHLRDKKSGKFIYVFNTHFPLEPKERDLSVQLLAKAIAERKQIADPVILTGDFNACADEASMRYLLGEGDSPIAMRDTYQVLHPAAKAETFHAFGTNHSCKIDYVFMLGAINTRSARIIKEKNHFSSDHFAVTAKLRF
jgi:endonuclease/exonuclease/phosphatase family metal-dependent hydrolase